MKIHCQLCKEIVGLGAFRVAGEAIEITCEACEGSFRITPGGEVTALGAARSEDEAPPQAEAAGPAMACPKCDRRQPEADACRFCGLRADLFEEFAAGEADAPAPLVAVWEQCRASWASDEAHERFRDAVASASAFGYGARCYRAALREDPDDAVARRHLERMARMAEATLLSGATARQAAGEEPVPYRKVVLLLLVLLVAAAAGGVYAIASLAGDDDATQRTTPVEKRRNTGIPR